MSSSKQSSDSTSMCMTVEEAAKELGIGRTLAYRLAREFLATNGASGLPVIRVGRLLRVRRSDLIAWKHTADGQANIVDLATTSAHASGISPVSKVGARRHASTVEQPALPFSA